MYKALNQSTNSDLQVWLVAMLSSTLDGGPMIRLDYHTGLLQTAGVQIGESMERSGLDWE